MVKALIAIAILALALILGGYALEKNVTPDASDHMDDFEKYHRGIYNDQQPYHGGDEPYHRGDIPPADGGEDSDMPYHGDDQDGYHGSSHGEGW